MQVIYYNLSQIVSQKKIYADVIKFLETKINQEKQDNYESNNFNEEIKLVNASFEYEKKKYDNVNLTKKHYDWYSWKNWFR